ncbi:exo-beta-N-acetylmuramidase NamZ family protein [Gracilibacillus alcaliphilus]|uniref:exo-beta-N-acetylmuramidase NamZ family protein n=1 Tax=Gracilibacillus alcaliphilus TaxID=1401441 RepID=UPI001EF934A9|nr:DUF1343 domain-containing protein [Gracilibacillus alcaliphilus]MBM7676988.1 uncharacterized protein YbbC (DUF1343 family) [Gracilibacillus alcaliphilus]
MVKEGNGMQLGLEVFIYRDFKKYQGKRIGLVTNMTGVNQQLVPAVDLFFEHPDINLVALFGPEHGIRGDAKEGEKVTAFVDPDTNLPVYSLYGETRKPAKEMIELVDVMVLDLQDIGSRYYTYIYTMANVMKACHEYNKELVVLDRPNPISGMKVEGNLVEEAFRSFIGLLPIPNRHGMTIGELASLFKGEFGYHCELTVIPMQGWERWMYQEDTGLLWVPPSPNTTTQDMMILYSGTCLIEGTNLSEGRGTTRPFEWIGAPFINGQQLARKFNERNLPGIIARPVTFSPTYQKYAGETCQGVQLHVKDRESLNALYATILLVKDILEMYPDKLKFIQYSDRYTFDLLTGTDKLRKDLLNNRDMEDFFTSCYQQSLDFDRRRKNYLLYK